MKYLSILIIMLSLNLNAQLPDKAEDCSPLLIGEKFPMEEVKDINGDVISLKNVIENKKSIMIFYRGGWCPYCNEHLSSLAQVEKEINELGYSIIAISPDDFKNIKGLEDKNEFSYKLYSDIDGNLIKKVGIGYSTPTTNKVYIKMKTEGEVTDILPVPSIFVLDEEGKIIFEYIHIDYKTRITEKLLISVLKNL